MASGPRLASKWTRTSAALGLILLAAQCRAQGMAIIYCSPDLTAGDFQAVFNTWQTNGACHDTCADAGTYAFAVLKGQDCWCSNYAPTDQVSTYSCSTTCAGFPSEWCGNVDEDLYGYYTMDGNAPSGTSGGSVPTSGSPSPSVSNTPSSSTGSSIAISWTPSLGGSSSLTVIATKQSSSWTSRQTVESSAAPVVPEPVTSLTSTHPSSVTSSTRASQTPTEVYTSVTTVTGQVKTILITPTPTSDSTIGSNSPISSSNGGVSTGKVVGIVVGVALGLGIIIGLGVWLWLRKRHQRNLEAASLDSSSAHGNNGIPSRQVSQLSSAGLLGKAPRITTSGLPMGINPRSADTNGSNYDRRSLGTDQRLNPYAIYAHEESRHSNVSLQDNQDYSRQLRIANPDP